MVAGDQRHQHELLAPELRRQPHRQRRLDGARILRFQAGASANDRRHEGVEGEDRRGGKPGQHGDRLAADHRQAERLARLQGDPVDDHARAAEPGHDAVRQVAGALGGATTEHDHVAGRKRVAHHRLEPRLVVRERAEPHRFAACLDDCGSKDRAVAVVDRARPQRLTRLHQLVTGRENRHLGPPRDVDRRQAAGRQHADLARADARAAPQQGLAAGDVGACVGDELAGGGGAPQLDRRPLRGLDELRVLDHQHRVGAARQHAAGRDRRRSPRLDRERRRTAARQDLAVEQEATRRRVARADEVGGTYRKPVHTGAIERRHVVRRRDVGAEHPAQRLFQRDTLARQGGEIEVALEARLRLLGRDDLEELLLAGGAPHRVEQLRVASHRLLVSPAVHGKDRSSTVEPAA